MRRQHGVVEVGITGLPSSSGFFAGAETALHEALPPRQPPRGGPLGEDVGVQPEEAHHGNEQYFPKSVVFR